MKISLQSNRFTKFIGAYHASIFIVTAALILGGVILSLYQIIEETLGQPIQPNDNTSVFDKEVVEIIEKLHASSENDAKVNYPSSRSNPFVE